VFLDLENSKNIINKKINKKKLENSYENYWFDETVDEQSLNLFKQLVTEYFSQRLFNKVNKLYNSLRKQITEIIVHSLDNIQTYYELINKTINNYSYKKQEKKSCFYNIMCCFSKKKAKKNRLNRNYNMTTNAYTLENDLSEKIENLKLYFSEKNMENFIKISTEEMKSFCEEKAKKYLDKKANEERLREEVELYSRYFKIKDIIANQEDTLQKQKIKMEKINHIKELNECTICMETQRCVLFLPCYHLICCEKCGMDKIQDKCPNCGGIIEERINVNGNNK
jgi:hypothetical protein